MCLPLILLVCLLLGIKQSFLQVESWEVIAKQFCFRLSEGLTLTALLCVPHRTDLRSGAVIFSELFMTCSEFIAASRSIFHDFLSLYFASKRCLMTLPSLPLFVVRGKPSALVVFSFQQSTNVSRVDARSGFKKEAGGGVCLKPVCCMWLAPTGKSTKMAACFKNHLTSRWAREELSSVWKRINRLQIWAEKSQKFKFRGVKVKLDEDASRADIFERLVWVEHQRGALCLPRLDDFISLLWGFYPEGWKEQTVLLILRTGGWILTSRAFWMRKISLNRWKLCRSTIIIKKKRFLLKNGHRQTTSRLFVSLNKLSVCDGQSYSENLFHYSLLRYFS